MDPDVDYKLKYLKYKNKYNKIKLLKIKHVMSGGANSSSNLDGLYLFKADWCGHCVAFKPVWENLKTNMQSKIKMITYDSKEHAEEIKEFKVSGFPTIILMNNKNAIEYSGPRNEQAITDFVNKYI
jgi:thioredoxin-like negative regulator of GroEL